VTDRHRLMPTQIACLKEGGRIQSYLVPSFLLIFTMALNVAAMVLMVVGRFLVIVSLVLRTYGEVRYQIQYPCSAEQGKMQQTSIALHSCLSSAHGSTLYRRLLNIAWSCMSIVAPGRIHHLEE